MIDDYERYNFGIAAISLGHIPTTLFSILIKFIMPREDKDRTGNDLRIGVDRIL